MDTPKRNDPCYCGSGKKYKSCHLPQDRQKEKDSREWRVAASFLRQDLLKYAKDERFAESFAAALPQYWNELYDTDNAEEMSMPESFRFFDWFAFDYPVSDGDGAEKRLIEIYRAEKWDDLSAYQRQVLEKWQTAMPASVFELISADGQNLNLRRLVDDATFTVYEGAGPGDAEAGDLLLARLVEVDDRYEFSTNAAYLPQAEIGDLPAKLQAARDADPDSSFDDFMRQNAYLPIHHALAEAEKQGRPPVARLDPDREDKKTVRAARAMRRVAGKRGRRDKSKQAEGFSRTPQLRQRKAD